MLTENTLNDGQHTQSLQENRFNYFRHSALHLIVRFTLQYNANSTQTQTNSIFNIAITINDYESEYDTKGTVPEGSSKNRTLMRLQPRQYHDVKSIISQ